MVVRAPHISLCRPARWWVAIGCALAVLFGGAGYLDHLRVAEYGAALDGALSPEPSGRTVPVAWSFPFQSTRVMISLEVDAAELKAAADLETSRIFRSRPSLRERYVRSVVDAQARSTAVDRLVAEFRRIRRERALDDDEYLELMVAAVQAIPYGDVGVETLLAPEVLAGGSGICTDKSLLLASLLVREGYDTVLWVFSTQKHVAVGVRSARAQFRSSGYAFIETTAPRFIGQAAQEYRALGPVADPPAQIECGGTRAYTAGDEVEAILAELRRLEPLAESHLAFASIARTASRHRERYARRALDSWVADARVRFIMTNTHDRAGVFAVVAKTDPHADGQAAR